VQVMKKERISMQTDIQKRIQSISDNLDLGTGQLDRERGAQS